MYSNKSYWKYIMRGPHYKWQHAVLAFTLVFDRTNRFPHMFGLAPCCRPWEVKVATSRLVDSTRV